MGQKLQKDIVDLIEAYFRRDLKAGPQRVPAWCWGLMLFHGRITALEVPADVPTDFDLLRARKRLRENRPWDEQGRLQVPSAGTEMHRAGRHCSRAGQVRVVPRG